MPFDTISVSVFKATCLGVLKKVQETGRPVVVTRRGAEMAVLVPVEVWRRLQAVAKPSLKDLLLSDAGRGELVLPERGQARRRQVQEVL